MKVFRNIATALIGALLMGCSSIDCNLNGRVLCHYVVNNDDGQEVTFPYPFSAVFMRQATDSDTVYINRQANVSSFDLPMSYGGTTDAIILSLEKPVRIEEKDTLLILNDTIWVSKTNTPIFESVDCAPRYRHNIDKVEHTSTFIESITINNEKVTNESSEPNIILHPRPFDD